MRDGARFDNFNDNGCYALMIKTHRLTIRRLDLSDCDDYFEIFGNPAIARYDDFDPITAAETRANIELIIDRYHRNDNDLEFGVELRDEKKVVGVLALLLEADAVYIGFHFNERYQGRGLASEAVAAFLPWLQKTYPLPVKAVTDPDNHASMRVLEKMGFRLEKRVTKREGSRVVRELQFELARPGAAARPRPTARSRKRFA